MELLNNKIPKTTLTTEQVKQAGLPCDFCGSRKAIYAITYPMYGIFDTGVYCYACLLKRCRLTMAIPFPIDEWLLNSIKRDMGLAVNAAPKKIETSKGVKLL